MSLGGKVVVKSLLRWAL